MIRRVVAAAAGVLALLAGGACTAAPAAPKATATPGSRATASRTGPAAARSQPAPPAGVTLAFAGDVHFAGRTARLLGDPASSFGPITSVLRSADFAAVNLETAITGRGTPQPKTYHFRAARDARFPYVGIGTSAAAAWAPYVTTIKGVRIAVIGVSQVAELASSWVATPSRPGEANAIDLPRTLAAVRAARRLAPIVIVFMHWGTEGQACPDAAQLSLAPKLAAAGASIIVGAHAHMLQGSGWLGHTFVAYGMG